MNSHALKFGLTVLAFGGLAFTADAPSSKGMLLNPPALVSLTEEQRLLGLTGFRSCSLVFQAPEDTLADTLAAMNLQERTSDRLKDMGITVLESVAQMSNYMIDKRESDEEALLAQDRYRSVVYVNLMVGMAGDGLYYGEISLEIKRAGFVHPGRFGSVGVWRKTAVFTHGPTGLKELFQEMLDSRLDMFEKDWKICNPD